MPPSKFVGDDSEADAILKQLGPVVEEEIVATGDKYVDPDFEEPAEGATSGSD